MGIYVTRRDSDCMYVCEQQCEVMASSRFVLAPIFHTLALQRANWVGTRSLTLALNPINNAFQRVNCDAGKLNYLKKTRERPQIFGRRTWLDSYGSAEPCHQRTFGTMALQEDGTAQGPQSIEVSGRTVTLIGAPGVSESHVKQAVDSNVFKEWIRYMTGHNGILTSGGSGGSRCSLKQVIIQSVDFFGPRVGFVKFKAEVIDEETGAKLPGIVFGRGGAVGILMLLECEGEKYAVLTEQARVPVGRTLLELPAGMLDSDIGDFVGTAAREIEEETGIKIKSSDLVDLTALLDESTGRRMFPSPGGSDEDVTLFLYRGYVDKEVVKSLQGVETGLRDHGELIKVHVLPYSSLWHSTADSKALAAVALYEMAGRGGVLPPAPNVPKLSNF